MASLMAESTYCFVVKCALAVGVMPDTAPVNVAPARAAWADRSMLMLLLVSMESGKDAV